MTDNTLDSLIGTEVVDYALDETYAYITLSDGRELRIERENSDCCSWIELVQINAHPGIITAASYENTPDDSGAYEAWIYVVTEDSAYRLVEASADASSGYYLHGFALHVEFI